MNNAASGTQHATTAESAYVAYTRFRPFALVSPGFEQAEDAGGRIDGIHRHPASPPAPYAAIELSIDEPGDTVSVGLTDDAGDGALVELDPRRGRIRIVAVTDGERRKLAARRVRSADVARLAFVVCENQLVAVIDSGSGWRAVTAVRDPATCGIDFRDPQRLAQLHYSWGSSNGSAYLSGIRAGTFGMTGVRDPHLVQYADGTPYVRDGRFYVTMTCAGMGFFTQAHWGVFTFDPQSPNELTQVAHLFTRRDGKLFGDHAGQIVVDGDECIVLASSWGDFTPERGVHVRHARTGIDVLHGIQVLETEPLSLPTEFSAWDPAITRIDDRWHIAYVESPSQKPFRFRPALAAGAPGESYDNGMTLIGADTCHDQCEGPIIASVDGEWRLLASDGHTRTYPTYDLAMRRGDDLDAPYGTNIPHPQLVGDRWLLTFDGTPWSERVLGYGTHGDVLLLQRST